MGDGLNSSNINWSLWGRLYRAEKTGDVRTYADCCDKLGLDEGNRDETAYQDGLAERVRENTTRINPRYSIDPLAQRIYDTTIGNGRPFEEYLEVVRAAYKQFGRKAPTKVKALCRDVRHLLSSSRLPLVPEGWN